MNRTLARTLKFACVASLAVLGLGAEPIAPRLFELHTRTAMPNLDEPLRYATVTEQRCLDLDDLSDAFWMLHNVALQDCKLVKTEQSANAAHYALVCDGGHGTSGAAQWQLDGDAISGTLEVKLGAKNMTFYQRITARVLGACR